MAKKNKKVMTYRLVHKDTGEHYTVKLSRDAYEKLSEKPIKKYSRKLRKHVEFVVTKFKK